MTLTKCLNVNATPGKIKYKLNYLNTKKILLKLEHVLSN